MLSEDFLNKMMKDLRQVIIERKPLQHMTNLIKDIPKDEVSYQIVELNFSIAHQ